MFLLDTNVVSEMRKLGDGRADPSVAAWLAGVEAQTAWVSAITMMELEIGVLRIERRDPVQGQKLRLWMETRVVPEFGPRTLPVDLVVATGCARLHVPDPRNDRDALIAATALSRGLTLATRNIRDFQIEGLAVMNPWDAR